MVDTSNTVARVKGPTYLGILWVGFVLACLLVALRLFIRLRAFRKLLVDDYMVLSALLMFAVSATLQQIYTNTVYELYAVIGGQLIPGPDFLHKQSRFLRASIGYNILFYTSLWTIKFSFLVFFRFLQGPAPYQRYWWWAVSTITAAAWVVTIGTIQWECLILPGAPDKMLAQWSRCGTANKAAYQQLTFRLNCGLDVGSDLLILSIPFLLLRKVQIPLRRKLALMSLFSVTMAIMAIAIIRVTVVGTKNTNSDITWLYFWTNLELTIAISMACAASFRQLFAGARGPARGPEPRIPYGSSKWSLLTSLKNRIASIRRSSTSMYEPDSIDGNTDDNQKENHYLNDAGRGGDVQLTHINISQSKDKIVSSV